MRKLIVFILLALTNVAFAGLFGPSNYEECVLEEMKAIKSNSDAAANAVVSACSIKFPTKTDPTPIDTAVYETAKVWGLSGLDDNRPTLYSLIAKITYLNSEVIQTGTNSYGVKSWDYGHHLSIHVTNRNKFPINEIQIGIPKKIKTGQSCSWDSNDYDEIYICSGTVASMGSGQFNCQIPNLTKRKIATCIVGFGIYATPSDIEQFKKEFSIPKRRN
jgi:hypothetical protein